jgi:hypothetical protein
MRGAERDARSGLAGGPHLAAFGIGQEPDDRAAMARDPCGKRSRLCRPDDFRDASAGGDVALPHAIASSSEVPSPSVSELITKMSNALWTEHVGAEAGQEDVLLRW